MEPRSFSRGVDVRALGKKSGIGNGVQLILKALIDPDLLGWNADGEQAFGNGAHDFWRGTNARRSGAVHLDADYVLGGDEAGPRVVFAGIAGKGGHAGGEHASYRGLVDPARFGVDRIPGVDADHMAGVPSGHSGKGCRTVRGDGPIHRHADRAGRQGSRRGEREKRPSIHAGTSFFSSASPLSLRQTTPVRRVLHDDNGSVIQFDESVCRNLDVASRREWLEANGIGGFASSTVPGLNTRRYHGLLVAATRPPVGRMVLLSKVEETLLLDGRRFSCRAIAIRVVHPCTCKSSSFARIVRF